MSIEDTPEGLVELVRAKLKESKEKQESKPEEITVNPTIDSPHCVRTQ